MNHTHLGDGVSESEVEGGCHGGEVGHQQELLVENQHLLRHGDHTGQTEERVPASIAGDHIREGGGGGGDGLRGGGGSGLGLLGLHGGGLQGQTSLREGALRQAESLHAGQTGGERTTGREQNHNQPSETRRHEANPRQKEPARQGPSSTEHGAAAQRAAAAQTRAPDEIVRQTVADHCGRGNEKKMCSNNADGAMAIERPA